MRAPSSAQWTVKLEETRIAVLTPAIATGSSKPSGGQGPSLETTRRKKYEAKNAPNSMTSETMKSRMPSVWRSIRELCVRLRRPVVLVLVRVADGDRGGLHQAGHLLGAPDARGRARCSDVAAGLEVLDRLVGDLLDPVDQALLEPLRLLAGEGRDQDLVDPVVLDRVLDRRERLGAHRLAGGVDLVAVELGQGRGEPLADLLAAEVARARADDRVAVRLLARPATSGARPGRGC